MQDIVVYISLDTASSEKETLVPLILSFEGEFAYKEYNKAEDVAQDFTAESSPVRIAAEALFGQVSLDTCPGRVKKAAVFGAPADSTAASVTAALDTLRETCDGWYFLLPTTVDTEILEALSAWTSSTVLSLAQLEAGQVESEKLLVAQVTDKSALTETLKKNRQTVICYNHDAGNTSLPAAWVGRVAPNYPTSVTWKWKELSGIPVTNEKGVDLQDMLEGRYNLYISNHGREYTSEGICTDGDFIDTVIGRWQIKESMRERLINMFVDTEVVPYDNSGFTMVGAQIIAALEEAAENGIVLKQDGAGAFTVSVPTRDQATEEQARSRVMPPIPWTATLRGGVHGVKVSGVMTVALTSAE